MSQPFLRFEDGKIALGGKDLLAQSAQLSISPTLEIERVYGDLDLNIVGAQTEFVDFSPKEGLRGSLDVGFVISDDFFAKDSTVNNIDRLFDISAGMSEEPINGNRVGRYIFNHMYLKSFSFSVSPFQVIKAKASYDIYGSIKKNLAYRFTKSSIDPAHGLKSFGEVKASAAGSSENMDSHVGGQFEVKGLDYSIVVGRNPSSLIRASEHTSINTKADGPIPNRVSVENIEITMSVQGNEIVQNLNPMGNAQGGSSPENLGNSSVAAYLYSLAGNRIAKFSCAGRVMGQSLSLSEGQYSGGTITVKQVIK